MLLKTLIISLLLFTATGNPISERNFTNSDAFDYLAKFGYVNESQVTFSAESRPGKEVFQELVKKFQDSAGLQVTGELDDNTIEVMEAPRCGLGHVEEARLFAPKWHKKTLTYRVLKYSKRVSTADVDRTVRRAMDFWEGATDIRFVKTSGRADIEIKFGTRSHGDGLAFDGAGGILAHAYFPARSSIAGDAHFDDDERWSVTNYRGKQLLQTTTHELGHSLGLSHSKVRGSVMYFSYPGWNPRMKLHRDDITRIQNLYGKPRGGTRTVNTKNNFPVRRVSNSPCVCQDYTRFDFRTFKSVGNCKTKYKGRKWCYIDYGTGCSDSQRSSKVNRDWSWEACQGKQPGHLVLGEDCQCNGVTRYDTRKDETVGHCQTEYRGKYWCYVSEDSECGDKKETKRDKDGMRYWSTQGCELQTQFQRDTEELESVPLLFPDEEILQEENP